MILSVLLLLIALLCPLDLYIYAAGGGDPFYIVRKKLAKKGPFLDALASLDSKLSVSQSVIDVFRLTHLRVFQSYSRCYVHFTWFGLECGSAAQANPCNSGPPPQIRPEYYHGEKEVLFRRFSSLFWHFLLPHRLYACQIHLLQKESALLPPKLQRRGLVF